MKRKRRKIILAFIIIILLLVVCIGTGIIDIRKITNNMNILSAIHGDPINLDTGIINNEYFNISSNGQDAKNTTEGLCKAIEYASNNNITNIKLEEGEYLVNGEGEQNTKKGIVLASNINLDLNNSKILHEMNGSTRYSAFVLYNLENVTICNGTLIGDRYTHDYDSSDSTHQWGYGLEIKGCENLQIYNLEIREFTGDGIVISNYPDTKTSSNIKIYNNNIYDCRRQGVTITCGKDIKIYNNEIHSINGIQPGCSIDLEPDNASQLVENIEIYNNKMHNENRSNIVQVHTYVKNIHIYDNEINGNIIVCGVKDKVKIENNHIKNGNMYFAIIEKNRNNPDFMNKIEMVGNIIESCTFTIIHVNDMLLNNNDITDTYINITSSNLAIVNNTFSELKNNKYIHKFIAEDGDDNSYNLYIYNNIVPENTEEVTPGSDNMKIMYDKESYDEYIKQEFTA